MFLSVEDFIKNAMEEIELGDAFGLNVIKIKDEEEDFSFIDSNLGYKIVSEEEMYIKGNDKEIHIENIKKVNIGLNEVEIIAENEEFVLELM